MILEYPTEFSECEKCPLHKSSTRKVFERGEFSLGLMIVGEAPGINEDSTGLPFIGESGQLLEKMLASIGIDSSRDCMVVNALKCMPGRKSGGYNKPTMPEIKKCRYQLEFQIESSEPLAILALGATANQSLSNDGRYSISKQVGVPYDIEVKGEIYKVFPAYHPAALLRAESMANGSNYHQTWQCLLKLSRYLMEKNDDYSQTITTSLLETCHDSVTLSNKQE